MTTTPPVSSTPVVGTASKVSSATSAAAQEDRFMTLLVAQMKNQDPLNPMDNAQMTSQIAQINTVGGIEKLNTTVESLLTAFGNLQAQSANDLAGRDVLVAGPSLSLAGGKATGGVSLAGAADHVAVEMLDASGQTVRTINLGASTAGVHSFTWDGKRDDGQQATDGGYRMRVTATASGTAVAAKSLTAAHVQSVNDAVTGVQLDLGAGGLQPLTAVQSYL